VLRLREDFFNCLTPFFLALRVRSRAKHRILSATVASTAPDILADDNPVIRKGLKASIEEEASLQDFAEASDGQEALKLIGKLRPHFAILYIDMPKLDGLDVAKEVAMLKLSTKVIFLASHKTRISFALS
jgi:DNA-binding NtrC family response regulator